jgi:hypothetical protein
VPWPYHPAHAGTLTSDALAPTTAAAAANAMRRDTPRAIVADDERFSRSENEEKSCERIFTAVSFTVRATSQMQRGDGSNCRRTCPPSQFKNYVGKCHGGVQKLPARWPS